MRHRKKTFKLNRNSSHRRALVANMLKSLIHEEKIETTLAKAKHLKSEADKMITLAKKENTLASKRTASAKLSIRYNTLTPKEARAAKEGDKSAYNIDRQVINKLFSVLAPRFANRNGGYTRLIKTRRRRGDNAEMCILEYLAE